MSSQYYPLKLVKKEFETKNTCSFYLEAPADYKKLFQYKTAQFLTFRFLIEGKECVRSYSISSCPFLQEGLKTTVGRVEGGVVSNHMLTNLKEGDEIESQIPLGEFFTLPKDLGEKDYILFSAGIGITPLFSILKTVLASGIARKVRLFFSIRTEEDFIYKKELEELEKQYSDQLEIHLIISQKEGRLDAEKIKNYVKDFDLPNSAFYLCGPASYMSLISQQLLDLGVNQEFIHTEDFKVVPLIGPKPDENSVFFNADNSESSEPQTLKSFLNGEWLEIPLNREKSLLEQLIDQGHSPPFSCTSGSCMTCMAKLKEGKIFQLDEGILDEENIKNLEVLTCQCYPLSKTVKIDYDNI